MFGFSGLMISIKLIDVHIGHDGNVFRENSKNISHRQYAMVSLMFLRSTVGGGSVGLVLVFAATRSEMALRSVS